MEAMINVEEAGRLLGVSPKTIRKWVLTRSLPFFKLGSRLGFRPSELERWAEARRVEPLPVKRR